MPLSLPSLPDLRSSARANFAGRLAGADVTLRRGVLPVTSDIIAGGTFAGFRGLAWLAKQLFIDAMDEPYLARRLFDYGLIPAPAEFAAGNIVFAGTNGITIPLHTILQSSDGTQQYATQAGVTISSGTATVAVLALTAGSAGNQAASAPLTLVSGIAGVQPVANADGGALTGGIDVESDDSFRARGLARIRQPPQGGAGTDFWQWARNSGIPTRAWVYPKGSGIGTCNVVFTIDTRVNPIPLSGDIAAVQAYLDAQAPVIGTYTVFAPVADALAITINGLTPGDAGTQAAVTAQLDALIATVPPGGATYGDGITEPLQGAALFPKQVPGTLYLSMISAAIEAAGNIQHYDLVAPVADVIFASGHLPAAPTVVFT